MLLKFWAFVYRHTGYYSNYARVQEYNHVMNNLHHIKKAKKDRGDITFKDSAGMVIGMWQFDNKFYRKMKKFRR